MFIGRIEFGGQIIFIEGRLTKQELFTTAEKRIANYIRRNIETTVYMTIEELAKATYTSHSAIIRLYRKTGFSGFKELRFELGREVHQLITQFSQTIDPNFPFSSKGSTQQIARKMADLSIQSVKKAQLQIGHEDLGQIDKVLNKAQRIFLSIKGDSQITAREFQNKMVKLNKFLIMTREYGDSPWNAANLTNEDCAIFINYSGHVHHYERIMTYLKHVGAPTLLITENQHSEMAKQANMCPVISQEEYDFAKVTTFSSQVAFDHVLNTLFSVIYSQNFEENIHGLEDKQELIQEGLLKGYQET